jgi:predicted TIM-barrel fold metal-dependent hydrolase
MRIIDLHCYPNTEPWIKSQGPYVEALAKYWKRDWTWKNEAEVIGEFKKFSVEAVLVAFDIESVTGAPPCTNEYVAGMRDRNRGVVLQAWAAVDPLKGVAAMEEAKKVIVELGMLGFHFHPIMGHFSVDDRKLYPLWETINELKVPVMIDVGTTGMGAGMPGGLGAVIRHAHPAAIDQLAADFPNLNIVAAHPGWPWNEEMIAVALHKGNVSWELSGWAPKYFPEGLKRDIKGRLKDKIMFGSDYPSIPYDRIFKEWIDLGYSDELMEKIFHGNAERILKL